MKKLMLLCVTLLMSVFTYAQVTVLDGKKCPDFSFQDINGKTVTLKSLEGKYVLIDVWASWCGPCRAEIPYLTKLEKKFHGKNIHFMSLSVDTDTNAWKSMVKKEDMGGIQANIGNNKSFMNDFGIKGIPRFILLGKDGKVISSDFMRPSKEAEINKYLSNLKGI